MAAKKVVVSFFALLVVTLLCACPPVSAAPEWVTMDDGAKYTCQVDLGTVRFFGEETDKTLDVWIKAIKKEPSDSYSITHMFIKEYLMYMEKERGKYSSTDDATISSTDSSEKGWGPLPADSPGGRIAKKLFAGYRAKEKAVAPPPIIVDPQELQKALDKNKIRHGADDGSGTRWFYVRDTCRSRFAHLTFDFWLLADRNNSKEYRLNFSLVTGIAGHHFIKEGVIVRIDGREWLLAPPVPKGATSFPWGQTFQYSFILPPSLVQTIMTTKSGITMKWYYNSADSEYTIPADIVRDVGLMYAGCK